MAEIMSSDLIVRDQNQKRQTITKVLPVQDIQSKEELLERQQSDRAEGGALENSDHKQPMETELAMVTKDSNARKIIMERGEIEIQSTERIKAKSEYIERQSQQKKPLEQQVYFRWDNISYFAPAKKNEIKTFQNIEQREKKKEEQAENEDRDIMEEDNEIQAMKESVKTIIRDKKSGRIVKQIVCQSSGYIKPGELVAIMGPSGSGKTSLLNVLANRITTSKKSYFTGTIQCNGQKISGSDFSKFGAFVEQDDILNEILTCKEHITFSARIRSDKSINESTISQKVESLIHRLGLEDCQDTYFGGIFIKGLSGGEKKRTSIGYELISDPSLVFLDEPTSGLDSHTALKICKLLKKEAQRGLSILTTIHQPSADIFNIFDRVILMADGHMIYNGGTQDVIQYLGNLGYELNKFCNPADCLIKIAHDPSFIKPEYTIQGFAQELKQNMKMPGEDYDQYVAKTFIQNVNDREEIVRKSFLREWKLLFLRNLTCQIRSPMGSSFLIVLAALNAFLLSAIFGGIGADQIKLPSKDPAKSSPKELAELTAHNNQVAQNWIGVINFAATDQFIAMSMGQVMVLPRLKKLCDRERQNNMYGGSAYFLSTWLLQLLTTILYPLISSTISFTFLEFDDSSIFNYLNWVRVLLILALAGSSFGFMIGSLTENEMAGLMVNQFLIIVMNFGSGLFINNKSKNIIVEILSWSSPFRYGCEALMRALLKNKPNTEKIFENFGFTLGQEECVHICLGIMILFFLLTWFSVLYKSYQLFH